MVQKPTPRDPHPDNELIEDETHEPAAQSGRSGGRLADDIATRAEQKTARGGEPEPTRATKGDKVQPRIPTRSDHEAAQSLESD